MSDRVRLWCITDYKCDLAWWQDFIVKKKITYVLLGEETCPTTGRCHWQGWYRISNGCTLSAMCKAVDGRHVEKMNGSVEQNEKYCRKEGTVILEEGDLPEPGKRSDLERMKEMIVAGNTEREIFEEQPGNYIRYNRGIQKAKSLYEKKRDWEMDVRIYWGKPGTGKTRSVYDEFGIDNVYVKMQGKWWDGYSNEQVVVIDDFDPENMFDIVYGFYLCLLDRYPMRIECKGGSMQFGSKIIIFTSNFNPKTWFIDRKNRDAFFRRVKLIKEF